MRYLNAREKSLPRQTSWKTAFGREDARREKKSNAFVQVRSTIIRAARHLSDEDICKRLDFELSPPTPPMGLPESWTEKYGVKSYSEAYRHKKCRGLVQKLISVAKAPH